MIVRSNRAWLIALYRDGERCGWSTSILSMSCLSRKAKHYQSAADAERDIPEVEYAWRGHNLSCVVERVPPDVDCRLWADKRKAGATHMELDRASDKQYGGRPHMPRSDQPVDERSTTLPVTKKAAKKQGSKKGSKQRLGKPVFRITSKSNGKAKKASAAGNGAGAVSGGVCLCGCGEQAFRYLLRGHVKRMLSRLAAIKAGTTTPEKAFGKRLAAAQGPWKPFGKKGGLIPSVTSYERLRAAL